MKVSFDFDGTLSIDVIQEFARYLVKEGVEVWIVTARVGDKENDFAKDWNNDLYEVASYCGIDKDHIKFCEFEDKYKFLSSKDFVWHLDDDWIELDMIEKNINTRGISHFGREYENNKDWKQECLRLLNIKQ